MVNADNLKLCRLTVIAGILAMLLAGKGYAVTISDAEAQVARVLGHSFTWTIAGETPPAEAHSDHRDAINLDGPSASASVDNQTGLLIEYVNHDFSGTQTGPPTLTMSDAQARAATFMQNVGVSLSNPWSQDRAVYLDHGTAGRDYSFSWRKMVQGVRMPAFIDVAIDADTGEVRSYMLIDDAVTVSLAPSLTANDAAIAVAQEQNIANPVVLSTFLSIWYHPVYFDYTTGQPGVQTLYWEVTVQNPDAAPGSTATIVARVDANTGNVETILETPAILQHQSLIPHKNKKAVNSKRFAKKQNRRWVILKSLPSVNRHDLQIAKVPPTVFQLAKLKKGK